MDNSDSTASVPAAAPLAPVHKKENITPVGLKIAELNESRAELLNRIQGLKQVNARNVFLFMFTTLLFLL
ncbi:CAP-Gly domain-containing linker protein 1 isoform X1 [Melia azedarach]|uniref:CAP-Gly domain-containing linker protein 1 isoform X1 n=1 Tax=Melia azedarach TaxID=155640 RepID=A0ACC1YJT8_MELAZ|nr:CAP-Gly domain-containing linker protein 1 isoform X1 [Melia azedarach]